MKIVEAFDSFKECMSAYDASVCAKKAILDYDHTIDVKLCPLADGGEGTLETLIHHLNGRLVEYEVHGPLMQFIHAPVGYFDDSAIIECAKVCGLELLNEDEKDPLYTSSFGLGELMIQACKQDIKRLMICLGGSATNDGGIGMLQALGVKFYDAFHHEVQPTLLGLSKVQEIDCSSMNPIVNDIEVIAICDVTNPLCGKQGASAIYGPQKGLVDIEWADCALNHYGELVAKVIGTDFRNTCGSGAAGGLGFALMSFFKAQFKQGFDVVSESMNLEHDIALADIVIVGEGRMDKQSLYGKTPVGVLKLARKYNKYIYAFAGSVKDEDDLYQAGFKGLYAISPQSITLSEALSHGQYYLYQSIYQHMEEMMNGI